VSGRSADDGEDVALTQDQALLAIDRDLGADSDALAALRLSLAVSGGINRPPRVSFVACATV